MVLSGETERLVIGVDGGAAVVRSRPRPTAADRQAELAFFADGKRFAAPQSYRLQAVTAQGWRDLPAQAGAALANGITHARWDAVETRAVRVLLDQPAGRATRLVEIKLF